MWLVDRSLLWRMAALILLGAGLVLLLALGGSHVALRALVLQQVRSENSRLTEAAAYRIESQLQSAAAVVREVAKIAPALPATRQSIGPLIVKTLEEHPSLLGMAVALAPERNGVSDFRILYGWRNDGRVRVVDRESPEQDYQQDWFYLPFHLRQPVWVEPYWDPEVKALMVTFSAPVIEENEVTAIVTCDLSLTWIRELLDALPLGEQGFATLLSTRGAFVSHPERRVEMRETIFSLAEAMDSPEHSEHLCELGRRMLSGEPGDASFHRPLDDKLAYVYYRAVPSTGWVTGVVLPVEQVLAPLGRLRRIGWGVGLAGIVFLLLAALAVAWSVARPLKGLAGAADQLAQGNFDADMPIVHTRDEIARLTDAFGRMRVDLRRYIDELTETTAAKERIASELSIAREIQLGIVPKLFPPFPNRNDLDLYALLEPAREVGGDLYDFTLIDDDHLYLAIGDVSGKGVPASLMMAVGKTLLKSTILSVRDPARAMRMVNDELSEDNDSCMFITMFGGILNLKTGDMMYANAGHNPPLLARANGSTDALRKISGPALGALAGADYKSQSVRLMPGDLLALYTDGVTEAMNPENALFGDDRLLEFVQHNGGKPVKDFALSLRDDVHGHAAGAEPSDDITIFALRFRGRNHEPEADVAPAEQAKPDASITLQNRLEEIQRLAEWLESNADALRIPSAFLMQLNLALEEWVVNVISYAFEDEGPRQIVLRFWREESALRIEIEDDGRPFDPTAQAPADTTLALEHREIGGLGIHFIRETMDRLSYVREGNRNIVTIAKALENV